MHDSQGNWLPELSDPGILPGGQAVISHSWKPGKAHFTRLQTDKDICLEIHLSLDEVEPETILLNFDHLLLGEADSIAVAMEKIADGHYRLTHQFDRHGVYRFSVSYQQGDTWYWDAAPAGWIIVDPPLINQLRIYTMIPNACGPISEWPADVQRIKSLGFNCIHLLPLTAMAESESPYAARDLFSPDALFCPDGSDAELQSFVNHLQEEEIRLVIDLVFNHVAVDSLITERRPEWLVRDPDESDGLKRAGWDDGKVWHKWDDIVLIDFEPHCRKTKQELWDYMTAYGLYWAEMAARCGGVIRLDNLHSSYPPFIRHALGEIRRRHPNLLVLAEFFDDWAVMEERVLEFGVNLLTGTPWDQKFTPQLRGYVKYLHERADMFRFFFPVNSHDSGSPVKEYGDVREVLPRLVVSALMGPGPWGITQGTEFALEERIPFMGRRKREDYAGNGEFFGCIQLLNQLIEDELVFQHGGNVRFIDDEHDAIMALVRHDPVTKLDRFLVAVNLDNHSPQRISIDLARHGIAADAPFVDAQSGLPLDVSGGCALQLEPCGYAIYRM